ncbi:PDZ domain-containing protein [Helicobacter sp. faydin-H17]|uniref:DUF7488 domain-containing protein n=1 Tax=Helicobacter kayseriensis TaxID=2905877 RepID=UPI001E4DDD6D|nr:PDZ domain-containing protein [Helicobacter kayseriensis]MCE3046482.1 PDZ domain-containing protein [Helicobacter kayseriensis]
MRFLAFFALCICLSFSYDFSFCQKYYRDASVPVEQTRAVLIEHEKQKFFVAFFPTPPKNQQILKADPFIGLYILNLPIKDKPSYVLMPIDSKAQTLNMASISSKTIQKGIILQSQQGFLDYARFSGEVPRNGVISNICYQIYGLGTQKDQFIDHKYLSRFLEQDTPYYGDLGIRIYPTDSKNKTLKVQYVDPFFPNVPFLKDDEILSINQKPIKDYNEFEWFVSNLKKDSIAQVTIKRINKKKTETLTFDVVVQPRYGGFLLPDIFFDRIGIKLDNELKVISTDPAKYNLQQGLLKGDIILWINGERIFSYTKQNPKDVQARLREILTQAVSLGKLEVLISRDGFQFTINLINGIQNDYIKARYNPFGF